MLGSVLGESSNFRGNHRIIAWDTGICLCRHRYANTCWIWRKNHNISITNLTSSIDWTVNSLTEHNFNEFLQIFVTRTCRCGCRFVLINDSSRSIDQGIQGVYKLVYKSIWFSIVLKSIERLTEHQHRSLPNWCPCSEFSTIFHIFVSESGTIIYSDSDDNHWLSKLTKIDRCCIYLLLHCFRLVSVHLA
jgi:hypothetical protein